MNKYRHIVHILKTFEKALDDEHEIGLSFAHYKHVSAFPLAVTMGSTDEFITFELIADDDETFAIVQHYTQINFSIMAIPKKKNERHARRIGFRLHDVFEK